MGATRRRAYPWFAAALAVCSATLGVPQAGATSIGNQAATIAPTVTAQRGDIKVTVTGVSAASPASFTVSRGITRVATVTASSGKPAVLKNLAPATYVVRASSITVPKGRLVPTPTSRTIVVAKNTTRTAPFAYTFVGEPVTVSAATNGRTGWANVSSTANFAVGVTNRSTKRTLGSFTIIVPPGVGSPRFVITKVTAPTARGLWRASVGSCGTIKSCSRLVKVYPASSRSTQLLRLGDKVAVTVSLTSAATAGAPVFRLGTIGGGYFTVSGKEATMRTVKGNTVIGTPGTPIDTATTTVPVANSNTVISADLPQGSFGPVSVYYEPTTCGTGQAGSCVTATVDGVFSNGSTHLYGFGITPDPTPPASLKVMCDVIACPRQPTVIQIAAGTSHTCMLYGDLSVWCFGSNQYGQLGSTPGFGTTNAYPAPRKVGGLPNITRLFAGYDHTCAQGADLSLWCWGRNDTGQLGAGTTNRATALAVPGIDGATSFGAVGQGHTCIIWNPVGNPNTLLSCWGDNTYGQIGTSTPGTITTPTTVAGLSGVPLDVSAGRSHTCALVSGQQTSAVQCWGLNNVGQLGVSAAVGTTQGVSVPQSVLLSASSILGVDAGSDFTCSNFGDGSVGCWGNNSVGQLGNTTQGTFSEIPVTVQQENQVGALLAVLSVSAGNGHACAVTTTPALLCWGANAFGQAGVTPASATVFVATTVPAPFEVITVSSGGSHTCAERGTKAPVCFGANTFGQLGVSAASGTTTPTPTPVRVSNFVDDERVADYRAHPLSVSLKVNGVYQPFGVAPMCSDVSLIDSIVGQGVIATPAAQSASYCYDVGVSTRNPDNGDLTRVILFAEDPKFTPISR